MMQRMKGTLRPGRKAGVLALAVLLLTCVLMAGAVSADDGVIVNNYDELVQNLSKENVPKIILGNNIDAPKKIIVNRSVTIDGNGRTISAVDGIAKNHLLEIKEEVNGPVTVTLENLSLDSKKMAKGLNIFEPGYEITLTDLKLTNSTGSGITINGADVSASGLTISNSAWNQSIDVGISAVPSVDASTLTLSGTNDLQDTYQINSDNPGSVTVKGDGVDGYTTYDWYYWYMDGATFMKYDNYKRTWTTNSDFATEVDIPKVQGSKAAVRVSNTGSNVYALHQDIGNATTYFKTGDSVTQLQDINVNAPITIDKEITLTATDSVDKPTLTVPQVLIAVPGVTLDNLKIQQTADTNTELYTIQVTADGTGGQITVTDSEIIPVKDGRGFTSDTGAAFDITFTGNIVKAANEEDKLAYAIYINGYDNKYVFQENIIGSCSPYQFGFDQYVETLSTPVDISKNYWGGSKPSIELFVGSDPGEPDLTGQDTYYSGLNSDGTIDESSLVSPVEPTPLPPSGGSSSSGNMDNAYRVLFNDGATTLSVQTDLSSGDKLTKPETPVKDGYTFAGWYKDSACTQGWDFETGIPGDMTLYAKWTAAGSSGETEATATPTATSTAVTTPQPTKTQTAAATTSAPEATTAAGVSPTLTQAPAPVAGALFGLLAAGVLLRRRFQ